MYSICILYIILIYAYIFVFTKTYIKVIPMQFFNLPFYSVNSIAQNMNFR